MGKLNLDTRIPGFERNGVFPHNCGSLTPSATEGWPAVSPDALSVMTMGRALQSMILLLVVTSVLSTASPTTTLIKTTEIQRITTSPTEETTKPRRISRRAGNSETGNTTISTSSSSSTSGIGSSSVLLQPSLALFSTATVLASPSSSSSSSSSSSVAELSSAVSSSFPSVALSSAASPPAGPAKGSSRETLGMTNITAQLGASVFLPCRTHHSMERQVSWIRRRDWHILTSGTQAYTKEGKFSVHHPEGSTEWTLSIKYVALADAGIYECQISTGAGIVAYLVNLNIVVPRADIPGNGEYHVETGSTISLVCYIEQSPVAPPYIFWYHNTRMINYDTERGGVSVHIDSGPRVQSRLKITNARQSDSGNYTCAAANTESASITVYITEANKIAAIQPREVDSSSQHHPSASLQVMAVLLTMILQASFVHALRASFVYGVR
ncbi:uncharacterized protein LOC143019952 isoform X2 [Oratosquilla oratoria]|uniref:uncharacterized protein LOC143019952 isoform X2 n=1 Tax=Oratosquilla oratoria TaxID=337810 RepID=UPI003F7727BA